ncbi:transcriptional regulator [Sphingomonas sp.]|jgi:predicted transcriptional regulator|uniref:HVO_A0114 family putative DNA-binding protein n=1 Tax=Sphingomonas sp. TaxID=28214 RepID=UPI002EDAAFA4
MTVVTLSVVTRDAVTHRATAALRGDAQGTHISFATPELLWKTLTPKRWDLLQAMTGRGAMSIRGLARHVARDVKSVHGDIVALAAAGVIDRTAEGVVFAHDAVHVDFTLTKAA